MIYLADAHLRNAEALSEHAERAEGGYVLVLPGERGRRVFPKVADEAPMEFAREATKREGQVDRNLVGGICPDSGGCEEADEKGDGDAECDGEGPTDHAVRFVLAFAQEQTEGVGGLYEKGDVIHAYAQCACGTAYSDRWVVGEESDE